MFSNSRNRRWAKKLLRTQSFVVLTDTESVICFAGIDPNKFDDQLMLMSQLTVLKTFRNRLDDLIKKHEQESDKLKGINGKKRTKIKVKG